MKKLSRIKLINWHYFVDVTMDIEGSTLITGDNGSGKSTILDALQLVMTGGKARFNSAAHENARRSLLGYVRCKTGADADVYVRKGDVTSHVALEFYEESKKRYFIVGVVIDSSSDLTVPKELFYRIENKRIMDELFIKDNTPLSINAFKVKFKGLEGKVFPTQNAAQADFCNRFGSFNDRFFNLLSKALAFRPINNIKDFVYSYVLDPKEVNIDYLKENVRTYQEFEKIFKEIRLKIGRLETIQESCNEIVRIQENITLHDYILLRSHKEMEFAKFESTKIHVERYRNSLKKRREDELELNVEIQKLGNMIDELRQSMFSNQTFQVINALENELQSLNHEYVSLKLRNEEFDRCLKDELKKAHHIYKLGLTIDGLESFVIASRTLMDEAGALELETAAQILQSNYSILHLEAIREKVKKEMDQHQLEEESHRLEEDIRVLESKRLVFDDNVNRLRKVIHDEIKKQTGKDEEPKVLCELIHIQDELWQDAVEGYLNTQRFDLIIPAEYFDLSLEAYEVYKKKNHIHSVGLVNTNKVLEFEKCEESSLAYIVTSENKYAKCYINQLIGRVVRCEKIEELKKFQRSITPTCMTYQNNTARQINPVVYSKPYIGADAYKKQLEAKLNERQQLGDRLKDLKAKIDSSTELEEIFGKSKLEYLRENSHIRILMESKIKKIEDISEQLKRIDRDNIIQLQMELDRNVLQKQQKEKALIEARGRIILDNNNLERIEGTIQTLEDNCRAFSEELNAFEEKNFSILSRAKEKYDEEVKNKTLDTLHNNFSGNRKGLETRLSNCTIDLIKLQSEYNNTFHFGAAVGLEGMDSFQWEYKNLKDSRMIEYEEKINLARKKAEEQFREHFIAKLQENIYGAQQEFKKLNSALKGIEFGEDEYEFKCMPGKEYNKFYQMIMDELNLEGETLFTGLFNQKHKEAMDELFERITIDDEQSQKALEKFTDYRTFMDYDIKIYHRNGSTSSFSKVCREKSGGETQTPYYVAIAASFMQLYNNALYNESIEIMMFDEAFDKMDENRIESMMKFLQKLNLQVIIAAPPQKIESISPYIGTTIIVTREDKFSWAEALYIHEQVYKETSKFDAGQI